MIFERESRLTNENGKKSVAKAFIIMFLLFLAITFILGLIGGTIITIPAGHRGVINTWGSVQQEELGEGLHFKFPIAQGLKTINVQTQAVKYLGVERMSCASSDTQDVYVEAVVNYRLEPSKVATVFQQYGENYQVNIVEPRILNIVKSVVSQYTAVDAINKREELARKSNDALAEEFRKEGLAIFEGVNLTNVSFSPAYNQAIENNVIQKKNTETAEAKKQEIQAIADQTVIAAKAEAEKIKIQADAITQQGGKEYVSLKWVEKWNGVLPTTSLGEGNNMLYNIR